MKRNIILNLIMAVCLTACGQKDKPIFQLNGTNAGDHKELVVADMYAQRVIDTLKVNNGTFTYSQPADPQQILIVASMDGRDPSLVLAEEGTVTLDHKSGKVSGAPLNDRFFPVYQKLYELRMKEYMAREKAAQTADAAEAKALRQEANAVKKEMWAELRKAIEANRDNAVAALLLRTNAGDMNIKALAGYIDSGAPFTKHPALDEIKRYVEQKRPYLQFLGKKFIDVTAKDANGKEHKLSEYIGNGKDGKKRYVLVDFWASWCGPCMHEMPYIKRNWEMYRDKGFEVVGISLDKSAAAWQGAIKEGGYTWIHLSNLAYFEDPAVRTYNIQEIPLNMLVDEEGTIVDVNLRGEQLTMKLEEIYE